MSIASTRRTWMSAGGFAGRGWSRKQVTAFERLMRQASLKKKGIPRLVDGWDDGRSCMCWYAARCGPEEIELRNRCRKIFGVRERDPW